MNPLKSLDLTNPLHYVIIGVIVLVIGTFVIFLFRWIGKKISKRRLKIICKLTHFRVDFYKDNGMGGFAHSTRDRAEHIDYRASLDFFSNKQVALRNPVLFFEMENKKVSGESLDLIDKEGNVIRIINLPPNKFVTYGGGPRIFVRPFKSDPILMSKKVYVVGSLPRGKKIKIMLLKKPLLNFLKESWSFEGEYIEIKK